MIKVIYGAKGTGKTKMMIDAANAAVKDAKGHLIFITDSKRGMYDLEREVRFIDTSEYDIAGEAALCGFIKGVIAGNNDNEYVYIDGVVRIAGKPVQELAAFFYMLDNRNIALSREKLISEVWGYDFYGDARTLDTHIKLLRKSLGDYARYIVTLRGVGYRFEGE